MKLKYIIIILLVAVVIFIIFSNTKSVQEDKKDSEDLNIAQKQNEEGIEVIYLAGGCFWGVEEFFDRIDGVVDSVSGYANGDTVNPTYKEVSSGKTKHVETVQVKFNPKEIELDEIVSYYFKTIDPSLSNIAASDMGSQYRKGIYYRDKTQLKVIEKM